ncbi:MAG: RidA family protein [Pseudomonadota bacterium]
MKQDSDGPVVPPAMNQIVDKAGYVPAVRANGFLFCAGQVGRTSDLAIIEDPEAQFRACWANLQTVLLEAECGFEDVFEMTTYHVHMREHMKTFVRVKDEVFPRGTCAWTCIGVSELAYPGLLAEIKVVAKLP